MIERSRSSKSDAGQMCAKSAQVQNLHTCETRADQKRVRPRVYFTGEDPRTLAKRTKRATSTFAKFAAPEIPRGWTEQRR